MADLSKIKLNGTKYDLKDSKARSGIKVIGTVTYHKYDDSIVCDKTFTELNAAINDSECNMPIIRYKYIPEAYVSPPPDKYLYLEKRSGEYTKSLYFYEPGLSGTYVEIRSDGKIKRNTFALSDYIVNGEIEYDSENDTYSCGATYLELH